LYGTSHNLIAPAPLDPADTTDSLYTYSARRKGQRLDTNVIYCGDNLEVLPKYFPTASVDLIYIDPPFNTSRNYEVFWGEAQERRMFEDRFGDAIHYTEWMKPRIKELWRVLKPSGSLYFHCDWHASHYIKVELLDRIFGFDNFRAEIIWQRTSAHPSARRLANTHDSIFFYTKGKKYTWNPLHHEPNQNYVRTHYIYTDARGRYRAADLTGAGISRGASGQDWRGFSPTSKGRHWSNVPETLEHMDAMGMIHWPKKKDGWPAKKVYWDDSKMQVRPLQSIWSDIPPVNSQAKERLGFPTQKPLPLLERIIQVSSNEGDVVLDAFCGCGTSLEAAAIHKRHWVGIDRSPTACHIMGERLEKIGLHLGEDFLISDMPKTETDLRRMPPHEFQNWAVVALGGRPNTAMNRDFGIDGRVYVADLPKPRQMELDLFGDHDNWFPVQVKQQDNVGRPDIDKFETAMRRDKRLRGYFVGFSFTSGAITEIRRANEDGLDILPMTVTQLLEYERRVA